MYFLLAMEIINFNVALTIIEVFIKHFFVNNFVVNVDNTMLLPSQKECKSVFLMLSHQGQTCQFPNKQGFGVCVIQEYLDSKSEQRACWWALRVWEIASRVVSTSWSGQRQARSCNKEQIFSSSKAQSSATRTVIPLAFSQRPETTITFNKLI